MNRFEWQEGDITILKRASRIKEGGEGSGNFGHAGRPGEVGGSAPGEGGLHFRTVDEIPGTAKDFGNFSAFTIHPDPVTGDPSTPEGQKVNLFGASLNSSETKQAMRGGATADAIDVYTESGHRAINTYLRHGEASVSAHDGEPDLGEPEIEEFIESLELLASNKIKEDIVVYRGANDLRDLDLQPGDKFTDQGFASCSLHSGTAFEFAMTSPTSANKPGYECRIYVPKGSQGFFVGERGEAGQEYELILQRGTQFQVLRRQEQRVELMVVGRKPKQLSGAGPRRESARRPGSTDKFTWNPEDIVIDKPLKKNDFSDRIKGIRRPR